MTFNQYFSQYLTRIENILNDLLPAIDAEPTRLHQAMRYSVLEGGKRIRPLLVYATGELFKVDLSILDILAASTELIHSYSLIHDDLPAMDNDDMRRGKPSCHKAFDEATAILTGDALQCFAFQIICDFQHQLFSPINKIAVLQTLAHACNSAGMVGGQIMDLNVNYVNLHIADLEKIHQAKTGALIKACVRLGCIVIPELSANYQSQLEEFADKIGLAFQIKDDLLDLESDTNQTTGHQPNYPQLLGLSQSKQLLSDLHQQALACLNDIPNQAPSLRMLADYIVNRID